MENNQQPSSPAAANQQPVQPQQPQGQQQPAAPAINEIRVKGVLDLTNDRAGSLVDPAKGGKLRPTDPYLPKELVRRFKLKQGSFIEAIATPDPRFPNPKIRFIEKIDGVAVEERMRMHRAHTGSWALELGGRWFLVSDTPTAMARIAARTRIFYALAFADSRLPSVSA